jgi:hypothetical protein
MPDPVGVGRNRGRHVVPVHAEVIEVEQQPQVGDAGVLLDAVEDGDDVAAVSSGY